MSKSPKVPCKSCNGSGVTALSEALEIVFKIVSKLRNASAVDVASCVDKDVTGTAINHRLEDLRALGILKRNKIGKTYYYSICHLKRSIQKR